MATELLDLVVTNDGAAGRLVRGIERAVAMSFESHPMRHKTRDEVRRRGAICIEMARNVRKDKALNWTIERICDEMPRALRCELNGTKWEPSTRRFWTPEDDGSPRVFVPDDTINLS